MPTAAKRHRQKKKNLTGIFPPVRPAAIAARASARRLLALLFLILLCRPGAAAALEGGEAAQGQPEAGMTMIANPASVQCIRQGGTLEIVRTDDGGEYGICTFAGGGQCEEWALFRGECLADGVDVPDGATPAERYCLTTGGIYTATRRTGTDREEGLCTFPNGACDAEAYHRGACTPSP